MMDGQKFAIASHRLGFHKRITAGVMGWNKMGFVGKFVALLGLFLASFPLGQSVAGAAELEMTAAELLQSCDAGDSWACEELGMRLYNGTGVRKDAKASAAMRQRACDGGNAIGCFNLGWLYSFGSGVPKNKLRAASLYGRSCDGGNSRACANLGGMVRFGDGVAVNKPLAAELYARACDAGNASACASLAHMKGNGDGIAADPAMAEALYAKACSGGVQLVCNLSPPVAAAAPAPQCRTVKGTSDLGEVDRLLCLENDGQWRQRGARVVAPIPPPVVATAPATTGGLYGEDHSAVVAQTAANSEYAPFASRDELIVACGHIAEWGSGTEAGKFLEYDSDGAIRERSAVRNRVGTANYKIISDHAEHILFSMDEDAYGFLLFQRKCDYIVK